MENSNEDCMFFSDSELDDLLAAIAYSYERAIAGLKTGRQAFVVSEVTSRVTYSLKKKYPTHTNGYSAEKIAGAYAFWITKLKPLYTVGGGNVSINEVAALAVGFTILKKTFRQGCCLDQKKT